MASGLSWRRLLLQVVLLRFLALPDSELVYQVSKTLAFLKVVLQAKNISSGLLIFGGVSGGFD
jgi:hypothetical protein